MRVTELRIYVGLALTFLVFCSMSTLFAQICKDGGNDGNTKIYITYKNGNVIDSYTPKGSTKSRKQSECQNKGNCELCGYHDTRSSNPSDGDTGVVFQPRTVGNCVNCEKKKTCNECVIKDNQGNVVGSTLVSCHTETGYIYKERIWPFSSSWVVDEDGTVDHYTHSHFLLTKNGSHATANCY